MTTISHLRECQYLEADLRQRLHGRIRNLRIEHRPDGIVLQGQTRSYYGKQLAQSEVMDRSDLPIVSNEITVSNF